MPINVRQCRRAIFMNQGADSQQDTLQKVSLRLPPKIAVALKEEAKIEGVTQISLIADAVAALHDKHMKFRGKSEGEELEAKLRVERRRLNYMYHANGAATVKKVHGRTNPVVGTKLSLDTIRLIEEMVPENSKDPKAKLRMRSKVVAQAVAEYLNAKGCSIIKWDRAPVERFTLELPRTFREEQDKLLVRTLTEDEYPMCVREISQKFRGFDVILGPTFLLHLFGGEDRVACEVLEQTSKVCRSISLTTSDLSLFLELAVIAYIRSKKSSPGLYKDENSVFRAFVASRTEDLLHAGIDEIQEAPSDVLFHYNHLDVETTNTPASIIATMRVRQIKRLRKLNVYLAGREIRYFFTNHFHGNPLQKTQAAY